LLASGRLDESAAAGIEHAARERIATAAEAALAGPFPDASELTQDVYA
jgi:TPP-dependent pyruvate/acetoin dehydrogenase alpha subunit